MHIHCFSHLFIKSNGTNQFSIEFFFCVCLYKICRSIQLGGHSCGAHLCFALFDKLINELPSMISIIKSVYLFCGTYDVFEARHWPVVNPNNILSVNETNSLTLSPILYDIHKWAEVINQSNVKTPTAFHLYTVENDAPKLVGITYCMERVLGLNGYPNYDLTMVKNYDHFSIVEDLSKPDFFITKQIIAEAKSFL